MSKYADTTYGKTYLIGKRFYPWLVTAFDRYDGKRSWWRATCLCCGFERSHTAHNLQMRQRLNSKGCKNCCRIPQGQAGFNRLYRDYSRDTRGREFTLTKDEFKIMTSSLCHYCGSKPLLVSTTSGRSRKKNRG